MGGWSGTYVRKQNTYWVLVGRCEAKRPVRIPRRRWKDIKTNLRLVGSGSVGWINLVQERDK